MITGTAAEYFGSMVDSYDSLIRRAVPRYDEMVERLTTYLPRHARSILELGCGTGNFSVFLSELYPTAEITFVDAAEEMISTTSHRLREAPARLTFVKSRFEDLTPGIGTFDLITSTISLHHVADKKSLYDRLYSRLEPGGWLMFADQLRGATDEIHDVNWKAWLAFCGGSGQCSTEEVQSLLDHAEAHDHYTPLADHFALLREAGFTGLDCVWRNWIWGIVVARRDG